MTSLVRLQPLLQNSSLTFPTDARFEDLLESYFALFDNIKAHRLQDLLHFNEDHADEELPPDKTKPLDRFTENF